MDDGSRTWKCRNCGRSNRTAVASDGTANCEFCAEITRIQPSRVRGGETEAQLSVATRRNRVNAGVPARSDG
jgi:hypothetical protein